MKRATFIAVVIAAVMMTGQLMAQPGSKMQGCMKEGMMMHGEGQMQKRGGGPMQLLNLSEEQQGKFQALMLQHQKDVLPLHSEIEKLHTNLKLELTSDKFDAAKAKSIQAEISKVMNEIGSKRIAHQRAVRDLLTPEQRVQFDKHILSGKGGPGGPGGEFGGHRMGRDMHQGPGF